MNLAFHRNTVVRKGSLLSYGDMLSSNYEHAVIEVDALNLAQNLHKQASERVGTGDLNRVLAAALHAQAPPLRQNRRAKIYYATQVATNPPTIVLFTNGVKTAREAFIASATACCQRSSERLAR